jgi:hypothetical protein
MPGNRPSVLAAAGLALGGAVLILAAGPARAFCGFYVGKANASLFNRASQVILIRDGSRTVLSMLSDYHGSLDEFRAGRAGAAGSQAGADPRW